MIPLPLRAEIPRNRFPVVTAALIAANALAWLFELGHGVTLATLDYGLIPSWLLSGIGEGPIYLPHVGRALLHQGLGFWFISQFFVPMESGVAWVAHVAGFVAGLGMVRLFVPRRLHLRGDAVGGLRAR